MALVGINSRRRFEGQEPMELQTMEVEVTELTEQEPIAIDTTAPGKLDLSKSAKLDKPAPSVPLELNKAKIIELWENGILSNLAYVYCAIQYLKINEDSKVKKTSIRRNWQQFVTDWAGTVDADTGKQKKLTKKSLFMALLAIEDKLGESLVSGEIEIQLELL